MATNGWHGSNWIRRERRAALYARDGWACVYCGRGPRDRRATHQDAVVLSLDHLTPRIENGGNENSNLVTSCKACNSSRQDRPWREFAPGGAQERIEYLITLPVDVELGRAIVASLAGDPETEALR